jgi:Flp pilus assembly protein TadG
MKIFKKLREENGQAIVEFAITMPLLLLILCGIIDFGWLFFNKLNISNYTREATRYAIVAGNDETALSLTEKIQTKVINSATLYSSDDLNVDITFSKPASIKEGDVTVEITALVSSLTPVTSLMATDGKIEVASAATMRME